MPEETCFQQVGSSVVEVQPGYTGKAMTIFNFFFLEFRIKNSTFL
jgi:hypothetical protein